jgi:hypothetical protein
MLSDSLNDFETSPASAVFFLLAMSYSLVQLGSEFHIGKGPLRSLSLNSGRERIANPSRVDYVVEFSDVHSGDALVCIFRR